MDDESDGWPRDGARHSRGEDAKDISSWELSRLVARASGGDHEALAIIRRNEDVSDNPWDDHGGYVRRAAAQLEKSHERRRLTRQPRHAPTRSSGEAAAEIDEGEVLQARTRFDIQVIDAETGRPISGARVGIVPVDGSQRDISTNDKGLASLDDIEPRPCNISSALDDLGLPRTLAFVGISTGAPSQGEPMEGSDECIALVEARKVSNGDTIESLAKECGLSWEELARFNWGTSDPDRINEHLYRDVGCTEKTADGKNFIFRDTDDPGLVYLPREFSRSGLATDETHIIRVRKIDNVQKMKTLTLSFETPADPPSFLESKGGHLASPDFDIQYRVDDDKGTTLVQGSLRTGFGVLGASSPQTVEIQIPEPRFAKMASIYVWAESSGAAPEGAASFMHVPDAKFARGMERKCFHDVDLAGVDEITESFAVFPSVAHYMADEMNLNSKGKEAREIKRYNDLANSLWNDNALGGVLARIKTHHKRPESLTRLDLGSAELHLPEPSLIWKSPFEKALIKALDDYPGKTVQGRGLAQTFGVKSKYDIADIVQDALDSHPGGAESEAAITEASKLIQFNLAKWQAFVIFAKLVRGDTGALSYLMDIVFGSGDWDHKKPIGQLWAHRNRLGAPERIYIYEIWSNIHYGYVGHAIGFAKDELLWGASQAQQLEHGQEDDDHDVAAIKAGFKMYETKNKAVGFADLVDVVGQQDIFLDTGIDPKRITCAHKVK